MAVFEPGFAALLDEALIEVGLAENDRKFRKWLKNQDVVSVETFVGLACTEDLVASKIIAVAEADAVPFPNQGSRGKVVTLWRAARQAVDRGEQISSVSDDGKPIPTPSYTSLKTAWKDRHHFQFSAYRILGAVVMSRMWKHCTAKPKQFLLLFPEEMKLKSSIVKADVGAMQLKPGETPKNAVQDIEAVTGIAMLRDRIEAQFNTWAFVSVQDFAWFDLQDVIQFMDILNEIFRRRYRGGSRPTLDFFTKAYIRTMGYFVDQVSTHERTLKEVTRAHSEWIHFWTGWEPPLAKVPNAGKGSERFLEEAAIAEFDADSAIMGPSIKKQMSEYHAMARNIQNQLHQSQESLWKAQQQQPFGKGKGKGKRKWQPFTKFQKKGKGNGKDTPKGKGKWNSWSKDNGKKKWER